MRRIKYLTYHWTDSGPSTGVDTIRGWHVNGNHWRDIGYNWVILHPDHPSFKTPPKKWSELVKKGRPVDNDPYLDDLEVGAHTKGFNSVSVGTAVVSGPKWPLHPLQREAIIQTAKAWCKRFGLNPTAAVKGHRDLNSTRCPGNDIYHLLTQLRSGAV